MDRCRVTEETNAYYAKEENKEPLTVKDIVANDFYDSAVEALRHDDRFLDLLKTMFEQNSKDHKYMGERLDRCITEYIEGLADA